MSFPKPVHIGRFPAIRAGKTDDYGIDYTNDLATGETLSSVTYVVTDSAGATVAGVVTASTIASPIGHFRFTAPATAGAYLVTATPLFSDGRELVRTADLWVV